MARLAMQAQDLESAEEHLSEALSARLTSASAILLREYIAQLQR